MKKLLFLFLCIIGIIFFFPNLIPLKIKKIAISSYEKTLPGKITYSNIFITSAWQFEIHNLSWKYKNIEAQFPVIKIKNSLHNLLSNGNLPIQVPQGKIFYKGSLLCDTIRGNLFLNYKEDTFTLYQKSTLFCMIKENGTKAFLNHSLIPPFSSKEVSLTLIKGEVQDRSIESLNLTGTLALNDLICTKNHLLSVIIKILKREPQNAIPVDCGDIHFAIENGIASFRRTPFLIDKEFLIAAKGNVNFVTSGVDISIELMGGSLKKAFNFTYLPDGYTIPFKIDGTISNPKFHTKKAIASIAALLLLKTLAPESKTLPKKQSF